MLRPSLSSAARKIAARVAGLLRVRWLVRAPIWLYRARLGMIFGSRLLLLEHTGRKTGATRYAVLEVLDHPRRDTYVVASGFGDQAQWFRNVRASPLVRVRVGSRRPAPAIARHLNSEEASASLAAFAVAHPRAWGTLKPVLEATLGARIGDQGTDLPLVALELQPQPGNAAR